LPFLDLDAPVVVGEMAHVIAKSVGGPRGKFAKGDDTYANLILLCPTHHTLVDKSPEGKFTVEMLLQWKADHEKAVSQSLTSPVFPGRQQLNDFIRPKLIENHACWSTYGPESEIAKRNANSSAGVFWPFRKLALIVPNNRCIISAVQTNATLFDSAEYRIAARFVEHAEGFERNCVVPTEGVPRFPAEFGELFNG